MSENIPETEIMNGLNHSLFELERIFPTIHKLPINEQAMYADNVCISRAKDEEFLQSQLDYVKEEGPRFERWNTTGVGNNAFLALNAPSNYHRNKFKKQLDDYCDWRTRRDNRDWWIGFGIGAGLGAVIVGIIYVMTKSSN